MANEQLSSATSANANGGFRVGALTPDEAERFAALFVPTWESVGEVPSGPDPGFKAANVSVDVGAFMADAGAPSVPKPPVGRADAKKTMIGLAAADVLPPPALEAPAAPVPAPVVPVVEAAPTAPAKPQNSKATMIGLAAPLPQASADVALKSTMVEIAPAVAAPVPPTPIEIAAAPAVEVKSASKIEAPTAPAAPLFAPMPQVATSTYDADDVGLPRKRSPLPFVLGGVAVLALIGIFAATRGGSEKTPTKDEPKSIADEKKLNLPDPNLVNTTSTTPAAATTAAPTETAKAADTTTAKAAETPKTAEPMKTAEALTAKAPPPPPPPAKTVAAPKPPPPAKTAAPKPPPGKKPPSVKEEF